MNLRRHLNYWDYYQLYYLKDEYLHIHVSSTCHCTLLRVRCFKVVGSLLSNQNTGMSENTTRIFIPHERSKSTQDFTTSSTRLVNTLDLRHLRPLPDTRNLSVTNTTSVDNSQSLQAFHVTFVTLQ